MTDRRVPRRDESMPIAEMTSVWVDESGIEHRIHPMGAVIECDAPAADSFTYDDMVAISDTAFQQGLTASTTDLVNHPPHYTHGSIEPIDVIEDWGLGYHEGNALKYIARAQHKGTAQQDYRKAAWYLTRLADRMENKQ